MEWVGVKGVGGRGRYVGEDVMEIVCCKFDLNFKQYG